jgi:hypothetical protein
VVDKAAMESDTTTFPGLNGLVIHGIFGTMVIPIVALLLLIASFFAKVPGGITWALIIVGTVAVQVTLGLSAHAVPALGILHGMVALALLGLAINAGQRVTKAVAARTSEPAAMANTAPPAATAV